VNPGPSLERSEAVRGESWEARLDDIRGYVAGLRQSNSLTARQRPHEDKR